MGVRFPLGVLVDERVSIVVITRDRVRDLERTLPHLLALPERPRIVVVDNASSDGTARMLSERFEDVELLALDENRGSAARNTGVAHATTPYVAFADDDSWWRPGDLARACDLLDAHPALALVNAHILVGPDERDDPVCLEMAASPLPAAPGQPGHALLSFIACAVVVRRSAFEEVGGYHSELMVGGEEEILGLDLAERGWLMSYVPELVVHHHPSRTRDSRARRAVDLRNALWTTWLRRPLRPALRRTARLLAPLRHDAAGARGVWAALRGAPWILRERRPSPPAVERLQALLDEQRA